MAPWILTAALVFSADASPWPDCGEASSFGPARILQQEWVPPGGLPDHASADFIVHYPSVQPGNEDGPNMWPAVIFSHGMTLGHDFYAKQADHLAERGLVTVFPFVKGIEKDNGVLPPVTGTDGAFTRNALDFLRAQATNASSPLFGLVDASSVALVGHSMGGEDTIRATAQLPEGTVKVTIAQHPSLCGPFGPPPGPYTYSKKEMLNATAKVQNMIVFSATSDRAFLGPGQTPKSEHGCWAKGNSAGQGIYVQMKESACDYPDATGLAMKLKVLAVGKGHMCACDHPTAQDWVSPEEKWVQNLVQLYMQQEGSTASRCHDLIFGEGDESLGSDPNVDILDFNVGPTTV